MTLGNNTHPPQRRQYVIRRNGITSAFLYLQFYSEDDTSIWVESISQASLFYVKPARRLCRLLSEEYDESVVYLPVKSAVADHVKQVDHDFCENDN